MENAKREKTAVVRILATFNNIRIYAIDEDGNIIRYVSSAELGYPKTKRTCPEAAKAVSRLIINSLKFDGISKITIQEKGVGEATNIALEVFKNSGIEIISIRNITPIPHNACIPNKRINKKEK